MIAICTFDVIRQHHKINHTILERHKDWTNKIRTHHTNFNNWVITPHHCFNRYHNLSINKINIHLCPHTFQETTLWHQIVTNLFINLILYPNLTILHVNRKWINSLLCIHKTNCLLRKESLQLKPTYLNLQ